MVRVFLTPLGLDIIFDTKFSINVEMKSEPVFRCTSNCPEKGVFRFSMLFTRVSFLVLHLRVEYTNHCSDSIHKRIRLMLGCIASDEVDTSD